MKKQHKTQIDHIEQELNWLLDMLRWRLKQVFRGQRIEQPETPQLEGTSTYRSLVEKHKLDSNQRLLLLLALAPNFIPSELTQVVNESPDYDPYVYGYKKHLQTTQFIPTGVTYLFLLKGKAYAAKLSAMKELLEHPLCENEYFKLTDTAQGEPLFNGYLETSLSLLKELAG